MRRMRPAFASATKRFAAPSTAMPAGQTACVLPTLVVADEEGQLLTTTLLDYVIPTAHDIPNILLDHFETPAIDTLGGIKGVAEGGTIGAIPAIANAISDALSDFDISINHIPVRPDELLGLMKKQSKK